MKPEKILLVHLVSNGDCLMVTALARQIKKDFPGSHLTWAISYKCKQVIVNNPYIDHIWEIYHPNESATGEFWYKLKLQITDKEKKREFDRVYYTQIYPENLYRYDGTTRSSTFRGYDHKITFPVDPVMRLYDYEVENVHSFVELYKINNYKNVIVIECAPSSGQSHFNFEMALDLSDYLICHLDDAIIIITTHIPFKSPDLRIIDGSVLSYRENAELSKYATFFIGCSSGISWLFTSDWSKKIKMLQILKKDAMLFSFASMKYDFEYWGLNHDHIIEVSEENMDKIKEIALYSIQHFEKSKQVYNVNFYPLLDSLLFQYGNLLNSGKVVQAFKCLWYFSSRNKMRIKDFFKIFKNSIRLIKRKLFN